MGSSIPQQVESPKVIRTMRGLGDTIYQRAFIHGGYVDTPWPELFEDRPEVLCVKPDTNLRTQKKNADRFDGWVPRPHDYEDIQIHYGSKQIAIERNIISSLEKQLGGEFKFDLPDFGPSLIAGKYAVINPNTVRTEWSCPARNCRYEYLIDSANILRENGYKLIAVADLAEGEEWLDDLPPLVDEFYAHGEFNVKELVSLVRGAGVMVSSVGWPVPMCLATGTKLICIGGGLGRFNRAKVITDPRMDLTNFHFIEPDNYCRCGDMNHKCDKDISDFGGKFREALA